MAVASAAHGETIDRQTFYKVPDPLPLTIGGMIAAVGPQAINFGISIGGGEAYLLPNVAARGALGWHWLLVLSVIVETALVYECIKYSCCTGRSFFAGTNELAPRGFWPWFWAIAAVLTWAWPAWMGGAVIAAQRFTGISTPPGLSLFGQPLPPQYIWAVLALVLVLLVFYFSNRTYAFLEWFFKVIMVANIVLVLAITLIAAKPIGLLGDPAGLRRHPVLLSGVDQGRDASRHCRLVQSAGWQPDVGELLDRGRGMGHGPLCRAGDGGAAPAGADHGARSCVGTPATRRKSPK